MQAEVVPGIWTGIFPLLVGQELLGVVKLENLHIPGALLRNYLSVFFSHIALILSNRDVGDIIGGVQRVAHRHPRRNRQPVCRPSGADNQGGESSAQR